MASLPTDASSEANAATVAPSGAPPHAVVSQRRYAIDATAIDNLRMWSHFVAFGAVPAGHTKADAPSVVELLDLNTGATRVIGKSQYPQGVTDWVAVTGHYVAWTDEAEEPSDDAWTVAWDIHLTDIATGKDQVLASSHGVKGVAPLPDGNDGFILWSHLDDPNWTLGTGATAKPPLQDLTVYDTATGRQRTVVSDPNLGSSGETSGCLVYTIGTNPNTQIYEVPAAGGGAPVVVHTGDFQWLTAGNGRLTWQEPGHGQPQSLWTMSVPAGCGAGQLVKAANGLNNGNAVSGADFTAYWGFDARLYLVPLQNQSVGQAVAASTGQVFVPARIAADGNRAAWAEYRTPDVDGPIDVIVGTVQVSGGR